MTVIPAIEYPVLGISRPTGEKCYVFVAKSYYEMREIPLHDYMRGMLRNQVFVSSSGEVYEADNFKINGIDWKRINEIGLVVSLISAVFSLFNVPMLVDFDLKSHQNMSLDEMKARINEAFSSFPSAYFRVKNEKSVRKKLAQARSFVECMSSIS